MSAFTRTTSGLSNSRFFYQASFTVYIEGKTALVPGEQEPPDAHYYAVLMKAVRPQKTVKIKIVGNKGTAFEYAKKLRDGNVKNAIVIVDKDLEGVVSSILPLEPVIRTFGYSWENELWTVATAANLIRDLSNATIMHAESPAVCLPIMARRLRYLSALDAGAQVGGGGLLPKDKSLCGVNIEFPRVAGKEVTRIAGKYRRSPAAKCPVSRSIALEAIKLEPSQVVQGHFWSNAVQQYIIQAYRRLMNDTAPSKKVLLNLALSFMKRDTVGAVGEGILGRYGDELTRLGV
jgi:hypothetical protein